MPCGLSLKTRVQNASLYLEKVSGQLSHQSLYNESHLTLKHFLQDAIRVGNGFLAE